MLTSSRPRAGTIRPWNSAGALGPWSVANERSTMASSGNGFSRLSSWVASRSVDPVAKCHSCDAVDAQAVTDQPPVPTTSSSTAAPPPSRSTMLAAIGALTTSVRYNPVRDLALTGKVTVLASPWLGTTVTRAVSEAAVGFRMVRAVVLTPPGLGPAGEAGQYQVAFNAPVGAAVGISPAGADAAAACSAVGLSCDRLTSAPATSRTANMTMARSRWGPTVIATRPGRRLPRPRPPRPPTAHPWRWTRPRCRPRPGAAGDVAGRPPARRGPTAPAPPEWRRSG